MEEFWMEVLVGVANVYSQSLMSCIRGLELEDYMLLALEVGQMKAG